MPWWKRLLGGSSIGSSQELLNAVCLDLPGWSEEGSRGNLRVWRDPEGNVLSLAVEVPLPDISDEAVLQGWCRDFAEDRNAGMVQVSLVTGGIGEAASFIYKRLKMPAYIFTGMLLVPRPDGSQVWTVVAGERGVTGLREAHVTADLINAGKLTVEDYKNFWVRDPYDPGYCRVDRSVLRFMSDDPCYDCQFPSHPLSRVRSVLEALPDSVRVAFA